MALKGTAVIELTNVKTGEVERYEEHNLITKALEYMHQPITSLRLPWYGLATINMDRDAQDRDPVYPYLLGGIVLWQDNILEDASIITQPPGAKMIGCAVYNETNTTASPHRGSYNAAESYLTNSSVETSMKFVYDFATNQANGKINCLSLTSWAGGWNGFGGNDKCIDPITKSFGLYSSRFGGSPYTVPFQLWHSNMKCVLYIDPGEDAFYEVTSVTTTAVSISKFRANLTMKSVFRDAFTNHGLLETINISLPTTMSGANTYSCSYDIDANKTYIVVSPSSSNVSSSGQFYVIEIDMATYTATVHTMRNPIGSSMYVDSAYVLCCNGYLYYAYNNNNALKRISLEDSSYSNLYVPSGNGIDSAGIFLIDGKIYFQGRYTSSSNQNYEILCFVDTADGTVHCTGAYDFPNNYTQYYKMIPIKGFPLTYYMGYYYYSSSTGYKYYGYLWHNPNYLATINNLARPIEKTSDKTMKITYTIQEM